MKKVLLLAVAGVFVLASCAKDRTCECTTLGVTTKGTTYLKVTKSWMKNNAEFGGCVSRKETEGNTTTTTECEIK